MTRNCFAQRTVKATKVISFQWSHLSFKVTIPQHCCHSLDSSEQLRLSGKPSTITPKDRLMQYNSRWFILGWDALLEVWGFQNWFPLSPFFFNETFLIKESVARSKDGPFVGPNSAIYLGPGLTLSTIVLSKQGYKWILYANKHFLFLCNQPTIKWTFISFSGFFFFPATFCI